MKLPLNYTCVAAQNTDSIAIKNVIFTSLQEYGLPIDPGKTDADLNAPADFYQEGYFGLIKDPQKQIVGTFGILEYEKGVGEIRKMYLLQEHRRKGIGHFMMQFLFQKAKELSFHRVVLETATVLEEAIIMYEKYGFQLDPSAPHTARCDRMYFLDLA